MTPDLTKTTVFREAMPAQEIGWLAAEGAQRLADLVKDLIEAAQKEAN